MNKIKKLVNELVVDYSENDMVTLTVQKTNLKKLLKILKESQDLKFTQLIDLCAVDFIDYGNCPLYTSPSPRDRQKSRMPSSA